LCDINSSNCFFTLTIIPHSVRHSLKRSIERKKE
jgi:hypothetical protein